MSRRAVLDWSRFTWRASADRVGHAVNRNVRTPSPRTACGIVPVAENLAHPVRERCTACLARLGFAA